MFHAPRHLAGNTSMPISAFRNLAEARAYQYSFQYEGGTRSAQQQRNAAVLPPHAGELIDPAVRRAGTDRLVLTKDMLDAGLILRLTNWIGTPSVIGHTSEDRAVASTGMIPREGGIKTKQDVVPFQTPVFCTYSGFDFDARTLAAAQTSGFQLDTNHIVDATRAVNEANEDQAIRGLLDGTGDLVSFNGFEAPGLLNAPGAATVPLGDDWATNTPEESFADVKLLIEAARDNHNHGPFNLYLPVAAESILSDDYKAASDKTFLARLEELKYGNKPLGIRIADRMPANRCALVQMTDNNVQLVIGDQPKSVEWKSEGGGWYTEYVVIDCVIFRPMGLTGGIVIGTFS